MGNNRSWLRGLSVLLIVSLLLGVAPAAVWAEAAADLADSLDELRASWDTEEAWVDGPDETETPKYYSFNGEQVLEERPDMGVDRVGAGGSNLKMNETEAFFSVSEGQTTLSWNDTLQEWIGSQEGEPLSPPAGYTVTVSLEDIQTEKTYTVISGQTDQSGENNYIWEGKDAAGSMLPDGFYYWKLSAVAPTVRFRLPPAEEGGAPIIRTLTAPSYAAEKQMIVLDRSGPDIVGIHPLGDGQVAVEVRDFVGGLMKLAVTGGANVTKEWADIPPLRSAVSLQPGDGETLSITVEDTAGNKTEQTLPLHPYVTGTGEADSVPNAESAIAGQDVRINLATGNGLQRFDGFMQERPGADLDFFLTYNHQNRMNGQLGYGWNFSLDSRLTKWPDGNITWTGFDGTLYWFKPAGDNEYVTYANGQQQQYPNLTFDPDSSSADTNAFIMEWPDQLRYRFHKDGRFWLIQDRYTTEMSFSWEEISTYHGSDYRIEKVYDIERNEGVLFNYEAGVGNLSSTVIADVDGLGNELSGNRRKFFFMYNEAGKFVGYRDPSQKITRFVYDDLYRIAKVIDNGSNVREDEGTTPDSVTTSWAYDERNRVTRMSMTRKQDGQEEFVGVRYGSNEATVEQPSGEYKLRWDNAFHPTQRIETVQTAEGRQQATTAYTFSGNNLIRVTDPLNRITRYRYNDSDNIIAEQSPSGRIVHYEYDDSQDLIGVTGPQGYDIQIDYEKDLRKILTQTTTQLVTDPAGVNDDTSIETVEEFNLKGDVAKRIDGSGNVFTYSYDENGFLVSEDTRVSYENDRNGNFKKIILDAGTADETVTTQTFNPVGWLMHRESPTGLIEDFEYDAWGRMTKQLQRDLGDTSKTLIYSYRYDDGGNLTEESDGLTKSTYQLDGMSNVLSRTTVPLEAGTEGTIHESYEYDSRGLQVKQTGSRGEETETGYNLSGEPVRTVVSPDNLVTKTEYDEAGRQKAIVAADGGRTEYEYDLWDQVIEQKQFIKTVFPINIAARVGTLSEQAAITTIRYDSAGRQIEEKGPNGSWMRYVYDGNEQMLETSVGGPIPEWNGASLATGAADRLYEGHETLQQQQYSYDKLGRTLSVTDGNGNKTEYRYTGRAVEMMTPAFDESGNPVIYTRKESFDPNGQPVRTVMTESGDIATTTYDAFGHEVLSVNEEGQTVRSITDAHGRVFERTETVDRSGAVQKFLYKKDAWGNVLEERRQLSDNEWATSVYRYSSEGDLKEEISSSGLVTKYAYDEHGLLKQFIEQNNTGNGAVEERVTAYSYDAMGRQVKVVQPDGSQQQSVFDTNGNEVLLIDGLNNITEYRYDSGGQLTEAITYKEGAVDLNQANISALTLYVYDGAGNVIMEKDPNGNLIRSVFDDEGSLAKEIHYENPSMNGEQIVNEYKYDPRGMLIASIDGNGHTTTFAYDAEGQQSLEKDPVGQWTKLEYSPAGFITAERRPLGRDTEWVNDYRGNRMEEKDALGQIQRFSLDLDGRVATEFNRLEEATSYRYDSEGRVTFKEMPNGGDFTYRYDSAGNKLEEVRPVYGAVRYDYDSRDSLTTIIEQQSAAAELKTAYTYDAELNRTSQKDGSTHLTSYDYDELGRRLQKVVIRPEAGQDVFEYQYDANGNLVVEKKPGNLTTRYQYDFMNRKIREEYNDGTWYAYTYDKAGNLLTHTDKNGTIAYSYYDNNQLKQTVYPNGDTIVYEYNENGEKSAEIMNGIRTEYEMDLSGRPTSYTDSKGYKYEYEYDADGYIKAVKYPNGTVTTVDYKPGHLIDTQKTTLADQALHASEYEHNAREFITGVQEQGASSGYAYNDREQLQRVETADGDVIVYEYDGSGNRTVRKAIIQGTVEDKSEVITMEELVQLVLESFGMKPSNSSDTSNSSNSGNGASCEEKGSGNSGDSGNGNGNSNGNGKVKEVKISSNGNGGGNGNSGDNGNSGGNSNGGGNDNGSGSSNENGQGNGNGNGKDKDKDKDKDKENGNGNGNGNGNSNGSNNGGGCGWLKALEKDNGKKLGLYKKLGGAFGGSDGTTTELDTMFETGQIEHILAAIDNIVNGEENLPPGEHKKLFERIREVGRGYTVIGTNYTYNTRNQLVHRENLTRYEEYNYEYDDQGNLLTDGRSLYEWNVLGQLVKVTFPDGFGEIYAYDMLGRRISKTQFNHQEETQEVTNYTYKGDTWVITEERNAADEATKSYTFDVKDRPLSITFEGQTFWYVYNGHGDVMALTDKDGNIAARYEYDAWGLVTGMYNRFGERVREGIGWMGDLGTGNGSPGSVQGPEDESGNTEPDYHPGNGNNNGNGNGNDNGKANGNGKGAEEAEVEISASTEGETAEASIVTVDLSTFVTEEEEPTEDITTELVKENSFRYAGYYWDRKTQYYYLQARYYDPRPARFISEDTYEGEIENPLSLNLYTYAYNNPLIYTDPSGHKVWLIHGTFSDETTWTNEFQTYVGDVFDEEVQTVKWSGGNSTEARQNAADEWVQKIYDWHVANPNEPVRLVGHSHGGNVAILITNKLAELGMDVETLITIATPVREYKLETNVGQFIHVYNNWDIVQSGGGALKKGVVTFKRKFEGAENVEVKLPWWRRNTTTSGVSNHSYMHSSIKVWEKYIETLLEQD